MIHRFSDRDQDAFEERPHRTFPGILFHRRVPILVGLGILLIVAITLVVALPRQYQSQLDILVRNKLPLSARINATEQETVDEQRMQSELALLHSPDVAAKVVDPDYPTQPDATHTAADINRHQAALTLFSQQLITTVAPNSNLIHVVVTAGDPHRAGELASRLLEVFFASQSEVDHPTPATAFFLATANHARASWQEAQLALDGFRLAHPIAPTGNAADLTLQIAALNHQIQRNDEQIDATMGRILSGERKLITIPAHPLDPANKSRNRSASMPLLSVAQLNAMLAIYNDEQAILLASPPTDAEAVRASLSLAGQIADTNAAKRIAEQAATPERDPAANSLWQSTTDDIAQASGELKTLYATRTGLANQLAGFQTSLDQIQHPSPLLAGLQSKATALQSAFRLADQRANEARIADAMDQQLRLNVAVASRPSFSSTPTSPSPWLYGSTIALAVLFLAACLILFAGMSANDYEAEERDAYDQDGYEDYEDDEDPTETHHADGYAPEPFEDTQEQIPFPSRIRPSQSGAFLYAAPGASVPAPRPASGSTEIHKDPAFEPIPQSPLLSEILSHPTDPIAHPSSQSIEAASRRHAEEPAVEAGAPEPEPYPSPVAEIFHPHQYSPTDAPTEDISDDSSEPQPSPARHTVGEPHAAVPSFFAAPPSASITMESEADHDLAHEEGPPYPFFHDRPAPDLTADPPAPVPYAAESAPIVAEEPAPDFTAMPEPESIVTTPDPTPPWSQPAPEPTPPTVPPLSYWASVNEPAPTPLAVAPAPVAAAPEPIHPASASQPDSSVPETVLAGQQPVTPPVSAKALPQSFTSTVRPDPFLTTLTSTLFAPAFYYTPSTPRAATPIEPQPAPQVVSAPVVSSLKPGPPPAFQAAPTPAPADFAPDPELTLSYASPEPIELVPDPILPPVKPPYKIVPAKAPGHTPAPEPARTSPAEFSELPVYRATRPIFRKEAPSATEAAQGNTRPQTYEEMVRSLIFPVETVPDAPPARPTPAAPRRAEPSPEPLPPAPTSADPADDDAPPFHYARKSAPTPPAPPEPASPLTSQLEDYEALQNFIRRPSVPLQPAPQAPYQDDRTTYHPAQTSPPVPSPEAPRASWIDIAPPPAPRAEDLDPQNRPPDRISAIRDQSTVRSSNLVDESGNRLTPSQRMKRGRPVPTYDKDGKVSYVNYLNDQDKTHT